MDNDKRNKLIIIVNGIISLAIIAGILYYIGFDKFLAELYKVDLFYIFLSIVFLLIMYVAMTARIKMLLREQGVSVSWMHALKSHFVGMLAADFTPARSGYFATAAMLRYKYEVPSEKAMVSVMGPTIFDFAAKVIAGSAAVTYLLWAFLDSSNRVVLLLASAAMLGMVAVMILLLFSEKFLKLFAFVKNLPVVGKLAARFYGLFERMQENSHVVVRKTPELMVLLAISWSAKAISWYFAAKSVGIVIAGLAFPEIMFYFFFQPLITMLEFMPSPTIAGLGLSEGGATLVLSLFGIAASKAAVFSLLVRVKTIAVNLVAVPEALSLLNKDHGSLTEKVVR